MVFNGLHALRDDGSCAPRISNGTAVLRAASMISTTMLLALLLSGNKAADFTHTLMHAFGCTFQRVEFQITLLETCTAVLRAASMVSTTMLLALLLFGRKAADFTQTLMHSFGCTFQRVEFQITLLETCTGGLTFRSSSR